MSRHRLTMKEVALKAGVNQATVSRALANHPRIPEATRLRIRAVARELGYVPDPMLSALTVYRSSQREIPYRGTLGWIINTPDRNRWRGNAGNAKEKSFVDLYWDGAKNKAHEMGYNLEEFWLKDPDMDVKRINDILYARNIRGLLITPQEHAKARMRLDWSRFAAVAFGYTLEWPKLNTASINAFHTMQLGVREARSLGYRRIGLILNRYNDMRTQYGWRGGYLVHQDQWPKSERIPVCQERNPNYGPIMVWVKKYKPDAIICHEKEVYFHLKKNGYRVPGDIGFFTPTISGFPPEVSGIDEQNELIGESAVNLLVSMINRGEWGIPETPINVNVKGKWYDGKTMPRRNKS